MSGTAPVPPPPETSVPPVPRRRLGAGWVAFIVVDVVLVVVAVVLGISTVGGDGVDAGDATGGSATGTASPSTTATPTQTRTFASPTGNITCEVTDVGVSCGIATLGAPPAPVAGCDGTVGYRVDLDDGGVTQPCVPPTERPEPAGDDVPALEYGQDLTVGPYTCLSERSGVTCRDDETGAGFRVARAGIRSL